MTTRSNQLGFKGALIVLLLILVMGEAPCALAECPPLRPAENFDSMRAPLLPTGWVASQGVNVTGAPLWVTSNVMPHTAPNDAFSTAPDNILDNRLDADLFASPFDRGLFFYSNYNLESGRDGAVLEVSAPGINGGAFTDITDPAIGGSISPGYNSTISTAFQSPIAGRMAWSGNSGGYVQTFVDLGNAALNPAAIKLRFRMASDNSGASAGWRIDSVVFVHNECDSPTPSPTASPTATATPIATPCGSPNVIADPTFEAGAPWSNWTVQTSTNFGTPLCNTAACGTGEGTAPPYAGDNWAWFGGANVAETATLGQSVSIMAGGQATLSFLMRIGRVSSPFTDVLNVKVDGTLVQSYPEPAQSEIGYSLRTIDVSAFADGASHLILFEYIGPTTGTSNYVIDNVILTTGPACPSPPPTVTPTATATATPCGTIVWSENFDELPTGTPFSCSWISNIDPDTPPNDLFFPDNDGPSCCLYDFIGIHVPTATSVLRFRNNFNTDFSGGIYWDGAVLEVSSPNISGGDFLDITDTHVGGTFVTGGYTGTINGTAGNCLADRPAWSGNSNGYIDTVINLGPNLAGQTVTLRLRFGSDKIIGAPGWRVDTMVITDRVCPTPTPATPTPTPRHSATPTPTPIPARALNISTRLKVETGDSVMIAGFIITGNEPKKVAMRGIGTGFCFEITDCLMDPTLELRAANGSLLFQNDNWQDNPAQAAELIALGLAPPNPQESGIVVTLQPGAYTAILAGKNETSGVGLIEVYDTGQAANSQLANISTRGFVGTDNRSMIGGFILGANSNNATIAIRGIGPSLGQFGITNVLVDPTLELYANNGTLLGRNDDWQDDPIQAAQLTAHGLALSNPKESGIFVSLPPGQFTAILAGKNGGTGIGLVEIYNLNQ